MKIYSKNHSTYPRIGDSPEQQRLRRAYHRLDAGKISQAEFNSILDETIKSAIDEQIKSGVDFVTDGLIRAYDPVSHVSTKIDGFRTGGLLRFFDTNFYYRQPELTRLPSSKGPLFIEDYAFVRSNSGDKASLTMIGPYSLLRLAKSNVDFEDALEALALIYGEELQRLKAAGALLIQLDEPCLLNDMDGFGLLTDTYSLMMKGHDCPEIILAFYFGNCVPLIDKLKTLPVHGFAFDFTYSPGIEDALLGFDSNLGIGIVDCRNTLMENLYELVDRIEKLMRNVKSEKLYIMPSCGLEFLPRDKAFDKLKSCADLSAVLKGGVGA